MKMTKKRAHFLRHLQHLNDASFVEWATATRADVKFLEKQIGHFAKHKWIEEFLRGSSSFYRVTKLGKRLLREYDEAHEIKPWIEEKAT